MKLQPLAATASRWLEDLRRSFFRPRPIAALPAAHTTPSVPLSPLRRVLVTDGVGRTLFEEFAEHRAAGGGEQETGWVLLGLRDATEAVALATLPAGTQADAGVAHIRFNSTAQALGSRIVRQDDRRLTILGVVHTHPGSLRHPSDGDYRGDSEWVRVLRGREGVFAIGTADAVSAAPTVFAYQPRPHVQALGNLRFSWYALGEGDDAYRPLPVEWTIGPDLARPLHPLWATLEAHAERLERLYQQQAGLRFEVVADEWGPGLILSLPLAETAESVRVVIRPKDVRYYFVRRGEVFEVQHPRDDFVDRGVYLLLAELAARAS